jgi:outer membrane protein assembly factor BamA
MAMRLWAATLLLGLITAPEVLAQQDAQGKVQSQDPNASQAVAAAAQPQADEPGFVDKAKNWAQDHQLLERLNGDIDGWYPRLGGMTRGGGFAFGPGYRFHWNDVLVDLSVGISTKTYKAADIKVRWLQAFGERLEFWTNYRYEDFPQEDYFGRGLTSLKTNRTSYDFDSQQFLALGLFKPVPWLHFGTEFGYMTPDIGEGSDRNYPSIEQIFADAQAPGLLEQPGYLHTTFFADVDYRDEPGRPRSGGFYHVAMGLWNDRTLERYDFKRFDAHFSQYVPLDTDKKHVLLGRVGLAYVNNETGSRVPFYFLPYVGGVDTIRAFNEFRFRDENALWLTGEYNLTLMKWVSLAAFIDAGKVAPDWQDIRLSGLKHGYGFGVRVHSNRRTFARIDVGAGGGEGARLFLKLGAGF